MYAITSRREEAVSNFAGTAFAAVPVFVCDYTAIRTAARTSPCFYLLKQGTVADKQSSRRIAKLINRIETIAVQSPAATPVGDTLLQQETIRPQ